MFKILTYAYSQNIYSSRKIETACKRDVVVSRTKSAGSQHHCPVPFRFSGGDM
ncbi:MULTISPECIES: transposase [Enterocloster]|uniref:transposase n=1 Tax=Enterocloster TaxID=2719313 RepID=UPI002FE5C41D